MLRLRRSSLVAICSMLSPARRSVRARSTSSGSAAMQRSDQGPWTEPHEPATPTGVRYGAAVATESGAATPRPRREGSRMTGKERREQLLDVGRSLFAQKGFDAPSVEEIAARASVSK